MRPVDRLHILFDDADLIAVEKPPGLATIPGRGETTSVLPVLAEQLNVTVCGYVRPDGLNLYAGEALVLDAEPATRD